MPKPLITYSTSKSSQETKNLQNFLNSFSGINIGVDGYPGKGTSDAFHMVFGMYLPGDPRNTSSTADPKPLKPQTTPVSSSSSTVTTKPTMPKPNVPSNGGGTSGKKRYLRLVPFFKKWEGGLSRDGKDSASSYPCPTPFNGKTGWHTNKGITYKVWEANFGKDNDDRFFAMSDEDWGVIFKEKYWDTVKADDITGDSIAFTIVSWGWGSGPRTAVKQMQGVVGVSKDGAIGPNTLKAINAFDEKELFKKCLAAREAFFRYITNPDNATSDAARKRYENNKRFLNGWLNRLKSFEEQFAPK